MYVNIDENTSTAKKSATAVTCDSVRHQIGIFPLQTAHLASFFHRILHLIDVIRATVARLTKE